MAAITNLILLLHPLMKTEYESSLDYITSHRIECIHDFRVVRTSEASGDENFFKLATYTCNTILMGSSILRVLRTGAGKQNRIH